MATTFHRAIGQFRRLWQRALQTQLLETRCSSKLGDKVLALPRQFVRQAAEIVIELTVRKPMLPRLRGRTVEVEVQGLDGASLDGFGLSDLEKTGAKRGLVQVAVGLRLPPGAVEYPRGLRVAVFGHRPRRLLGTFVFRGLDEAGIVPYTERLVLRNLEAEDQGLWVESGRVRFRSDQVPASTDSISVMLSLKSSGFNAYLPAWETTLTLSAVSGAVRQPLCERSIRLSENLCTCHVLSAQVRNGAVARLPAGLCWLVASVAGQDIAALPFRVVQELELLEQVRVSQIGVDAVVQNGRCSRKVTVVRRDRCRSLQAIVVIETGILAPNSSFSGALVWSRGGQTVHQQPFQLRLDRWSQQIALPPIALASLDLPEEPQSDELTISAFLGGDLRRTARLLILPDQRIANFEGQLNLDPEEMAVHDAEYEDILKRLDSTGRGWNRILPRERDST